MSDPPLMRAPGQVPSHWQRIAAAIRHFPWQRMLICMMGFGMVMFFLQTHKNWVWAYAESIMLMSNPSPEVASVFTQSISAITTISIYGIGAVTAIVMFFITGNVAALTNMFKFSTVGQAIGQVSALAENRTETSDETIREFNTPELQERYGEK